MESRGDEGNRSSDGGGDGDMFEDMSEPEESGDLTIDAPSHTDQAGDDSPSADMNAYASSASASMPLSLDMYESIDTMLPRSESSADSRHEESMRGHYRGELSVRGSCDEMEAKIGVMLAEDDTQASKSDDCALDAVSGELQLGTTMEVISHITDQLDGTGDDGEASGGDAEPDKEQHDEVATEDLALQIAITNRATGLRDGSEQSETQDRHDCVASPDENDVTGGHGNISLHGDATDDSNIDVVSSREGALVPVSKPAQPTSTTDASVAGALTNSSVPDRNEETDTHALTKTPSTQEHPGDDNVSCASPAGRQSLNISALTAGYSVATVFPVVYEPLTSASVSTESKPERGAKLEKQAPSPLTGACAAAASSIANDNSSKRVESRRVAQLQRRLEAAERELRGVKKSFALQLSVLESDKKALGSRNTRLHSQLASVTADLQRVSSELARVQTENELYATKVSQLQAELLQETAQVDEGRSQSLQARLSIGQLKARTQVIQKCNEALEAANANLTAKLRESSQELRRKADMLEQQASKNAQLEVSIRDQKTKHSDEVIAWKHRLSSASQRAQQDLSKAASEWKHKNETQVMAVKRQAGKASKRCRELETCVTRLEEAAEQHKREICAYQERVASAKKEVVAMKMMLKRGNQAEAALRNELAAVRGRLRDAERDQRVSKDRIGRSSALDRSKNRCQDATSALRCVCHPRCDLEEDVLELTDSVNASNCNDHTKPTTNEAATMTETPVCTQCPRLAQEMRDARQELTRVRALHAQELRAQVQAMESVLKTSRLAHQVQSA